MTKEFKVGQIWKTKGGEKYKIIEVNPTYTFPLLGRTCDKHGFPVCWTNQGKYTTEGGVDIKSMDLVELIKDVDDSNIAQITDTGYFDDIKEKYNLKDATEESKPNQENKTSNDDGLSTTDDQNISSESNKCDHRFSLQYDELGNPYGQCEKCGIDSGHSMPSNEICDQIIAVEEEKRKYLERLRDEFAGNALMTLENDVKKSFTAPALVAQAAYELADAMLEARKVKS